MEDDANVPVSWIIVSYIVACSNLLAFVSCFFALQALMRDSSIRQNAYNIYVIFLILPDSLQNLFAVIRNSFLERFPQGFYEIYIFVWFFYFTSNFYLNSVVAYEINKLVTASFRRQKTSPPTVGRAWKQIAVVYLFSLLISLWFALPYKWSPFDIDDGLHGSWKFGSPDGGVFGSMAAPLIGFGLIGIPFIYVLCIRLRIACYNLLPKRGRTRVLSLFFMRIIVVFLVFYLPGTIFTASLAFFDDNSAPQFWITNVIVQLFNAFQAYVTLYMVLMKDDIRKAVANSWNDSFGKCCCRMATLVERRPSVTPTGLPSFRPPVGISNVNNPCSAMPPSVNDRIDQGQSKMSEWDEEDFYEQADQEPANCPESHPSVPRDEEMPPNFRDCTNDWVGRQASGDT